MRRKHYGVSALAQRMLKGRRCNELSGLCELRALVGRFVDALCLAHRVLTGESLSVFFDRSEIETECTTS